jgi:hypothetical protein
MTGRESMLKGIKQLFQVRNTRKLKPWRPDFIDPATHEEYEALKADISQNGIHVPIILQPDGTIIDGNTRHQIATELGIPRIKAMVYERMLNESEVRLAAACLQKNRRHTMNTLSKYILIYEICKQSGFKPGEVGRGRNRPEPGSGLSGGEVGKEQRLTQEEIARDWGLSDRAVRKACHVAEAYYLLVSKGYNKEKLKKMTIKEILILERQTKREDLPTDDVEDEEWMGQRPYRENDTADGYVLISRSIVRHPKLWADANALKLFLLLLVCAQWGSYDRDDYLGHPVHLERGEVFYYGFGGLGKMCRIDKKTVMRAIDSLVEWGIVSKPEKAGVGFKTKILKYDYYQNRANYGSQRKERDESAVSSEGNNGTEVGKISTDLGKIRTQNNTNKHKDNNIISDRNSEDKTMDTSEDENTVCLATGEKYNPVDGGIYFSHGHCPTSPANFNSDKAPDCPHLFDCLAACYSDLVQSFYDEPQIERWYPKFFQGEDMSEWGIHNCMNKEELQDQAARLLITASVLNINPRDYIHLAFKDAQKGYLPTFKRLGSRDGLIALLKFRKEGGNISRDLKQYDQATNAHLK